MKKLLSLAVVFMTMTAHAQKQVSATSPDGQTKVTVTVADRIYYDVESHGEQLFQQCHIGMTLSDRTLGEKPVLKGKKVTTVNETITPIHPLKYSKVENNYTQLTLTFGGNYKVEWRVYNDGVAYRFITALKGDIEVLGEDGTWQLAKPSRLVLQQPGGFKTSCEENYSVMATLSSISSIMPACSSSLAAKAAMPSPSSSPSVQQNTKTRATAATRS